MILILFSYSKIRLNNQQWLSSLVNVITSTISNYLIFFFLIHICILILYFLCCNKALINCFSFE